LLSCEFDVIDAVNNAFGEWIVTAETRPVEIVPRPHTIGKAILCSRFVHGPEDVVEGSLNGNDSGAKEWYTGWRRLVTPSKQRAVDLFVPLQLGISDKCRLGQTTFMLRDAGSNTILDNGGARADVEHEVLTFAKNKDIDAPYVVRNDRREGQEPIDAGWCDSIDDVKKAGTICEADVGKQGSQVVKRRKKCTKARIDPVGDIDTQPGVVKYECLDVLSIV